MKKLFRILFMTLVILTYSHQVLYSQITTQEKSKTYFTWVKKIDNSYSKAGYLSDLNDRMISINTVEKNDIKIYRIENIKYLQFRKKGNEIKGFLSGTLIGFSIGAIAGYIGIGSGTGFFDEWGGGCVECAIILGIPCGISGALIGGIIGGNKIMIPINGNHDNYNSQRAKLEKYKYKY